MKIFISTGGEKNFTPIDTAKKFFASGIKNIELSGGIYSDSFEKDLFDLPNEVNLQLHNYCPPPKVPFVLNLSSVNKDICDKTMLHIRSAIEMSTKIKNPFYAFHAGFRFDPNLGELGRKLRKENLIERTKAIDLFLDRIKILSKEAYNLGITLFIENNVISKQNLNNFNEDPLLFTEPNEIIYIMNNVPKNVKFLLDVAHLKVSSNSLGFNLIEAHENLKDYISAYHLSDNNGNKDTNNMITKTSWFLPYMKTDAKFYTIEVYGLLPEKLVLQYDLVKSVIAK